jgi:uncharacterized protein
MNESIPEGRLSEEEFDRLDTFLETLDDGILNVEMLDGFFAALISGPEIVPIDESLSVVWGENHTFESAEQEADMTNLVMRHFSSVAMGFVKIEDDTDGYSPVLFEEEDGFVAANAWACGFMAGVEMRREKWDPLMDDEELAWTLVPMLMFCHEHDTDPELRPPAIKPEEREELIDNMLAGAICINRHFEAQRRGVIEPIRRDGPKVGRNDPCPCGSGKKYKQCCGSANA